jgi:hypothetical protein
MIGFMEENNDNDDHDEHYYDYDYVFLTSILGKSE